MNKFWSKVKQTYVKFRKMIGWYHVRELWITAVPLNEESEVHLCGNLGLGEDGLKTYEKLLNLQGKIDWNDCWMERVRFVGRLGDWPSNNDLMPGMLYMLSYHINLYAKKENVPNQTFYIPSNLEILSGHTLELYHEVEGQIPSVCLIHYYANGFDADLDYKSALARVENEARRLNDFNHIFSN